MKINRRVLNGRLLFGTVLGTVVLAGGVHLLHGIQVKRTAVSLRDRAEQADRAGDPVTAGRYLERYLVYRPSDVDAIVRLAELAKKRLNTQDMRKAASLFEKAVRLAPGRTEVRRRLVDLMFAEDRFSDAKVHVQALIVSSPNDAKLKMMLGQCEEGTGRFREAASLYDAARRLDPTLVASYTRLAEVLRTRSSDPAQADAVMDAKAEKDGVVAMNPKSAAAYLARASYRSAYAVPGVDPSADVAEALVLAPDDAEVRLAAARVALSKNDAAAAREHLEYGVKIHPEVTLFYRLLSEIEAVSGDVDKAVDWLRRGVASLGPNQDDERSTLKWMLADLLIRNNRLHQADEVIADLKKARVRAELLNYLDATALAARGRHAEASTALAAVAPLLAVVPEFSGLAKRSWVLLAQAQEKLGKADQQLDAYRRAVAITIEPDPMRIPAQLGLASSLASMDRIDEAIDEYRRLKDDLNAEMAVARLLILQNLRRAEGERRWDEVNRAIDVLEKRLPGIDDRSRAAAEIAILRAEALAGQGQVSKAQSLIDRTLAEFRDQVSLWVAAANLAGRNGTPEAVLSVLDDAQKHLGDRIELRQARAACWANKGGDEAAAALEGLERGIEAFTPDDVEALRRTLSSCYERIGKAAEAQRLWQQAIADRPEDLNSWLTLFDLALRSKDRSTAAHALDQIRKIEGEQGALWHFARASLLLDAFQASPKDRSALAETRGELEVAAKLRPSWPRIRVALAQVCELEGRPDDAIPQYLSAILQLGDRSPGAVRRVAQLLSERQRFSEAELVLKKLRDEHVPLSDDLQRLAAQVAFRNQDFSGALERASEVVPDTSDNVQDLLWLAQVRWAADKPTEPILRRAVSLAKDSPAPRLALINYLVATGKQADAEGLLKETEHVLPLESSRLVLAQGYELVGQMEKADRLFAEALAAQPNDLDTLRASASFDLQHGHPDRAETSLRKIIDLGAATGEASWARRVLASAMASRGEHKRTLEALEILGLPGEADVAAGAVGNNRSPEDLRTRAQILALQPSRARRSESIAILEQLAKRGVSQLEDLYLLAQLYEAGGEWDESRARWQELLQKRGASPNHMAAYIHALIRHEQMDEARLVLGKLEKFAAGQPIELKARAHLLQAENHEDRAAALLTEYAHKDAERLDPTARLCEELGLYDEAEKLYRTAVEKSSAGKPVAAVRLADFLGRRGRTREALDLIDEFAWPTLPPEQVSNVELTILYGAETSDALAFYERFASRLEALIVKTPRSLALRFDLANLRCLQARYDDAERLFREIAAENPSLGLPLNNLAWMTVMRGGKAEEALKLIDGAITLEGEDPDLLDTRGLAHLAAGRIDQAARDIEDAIAVSPSPDKYFHLAQAYLAAGKRGDADRAWKQAATQGLKLEQLHPLERNAFHTLAAKLKN